VDLKTYRSNSMASALAEVKKDLGPDAVILRTRNYKAGGVMGFGGNTVVEITAARESPPKNPNGRARSPGEPFDAEAIERMRAAAHAKIKQARSATNGERTATAIDQTEPTPKADRTAEFKPLIDESHAAEHTDARTLRPEPSPPRVEPTRVSFKPEGERTHAALEAELASIRELVSDVLRTTRKTAIRVEGSGAFAASAVSTNDPLYSLYGTLCDNEVPTDLADEIVGEVRNGLDPSESHEPAIIRESALRAIAARLPIAASVPDQPVRAERDEKGRFLPVSKGGKVQALIGPTGVGKTTTIAKLAASYKLRHGKRVGLITADTYRIAAVDQLRTYAGIIGIPLEIALAPADIAPALAKFEQCDVVLVDTPGRSPRDTARLDELSAVLDAIGPARTHLVLSAGASVPVLKSAARCFGAMNPDTLIVSKADEAGALGVLLDIARLTGLPLSYLTTGQEVPDDIEPARADRLARAVLEGGLPA
jgi:flagellar biosynthesis protein FlhF